MMFLLNESKEFQPSRSFVYGIACLLLLTSIGHARDTVISDRLADSTLAWVRFRQVQNWADAYPRTALRRLVEAEPMSEFREEIGRILNDGEHTQRIGAAWQELKSYVDGDVVLAWSPGKADRKLDTLTAWQISGREQLLELRTEVVNRFRKRGFQVEVAVVGDLKVDVFKPNDDSGTRYAASVAEWFVLADALEPIQALVSKDAERLVKAKDFQAIATSTFEADEQASPNRSQIRLNWFLRPWKLSDRWPETRDEKQIKRALDGGFDSVSAIGGELSFPEASVYTSYRTAIYYQEPLQSAARMLTFEPRALSRLPAWLGDEASYVRLVHANLATALAGYGSWFDSSIGQGNEGLFESALDDMRDDPKGPQVDVRSEILPYLTGPIYSVDTTGATGEMRRVFAIETRRTQVVAEAIAKIMENDPEVDEVKLGNFTGWVFQDLTHGGTRQVIGPDLSGLTVCVAQGFLFASLNQSAVLSAVTGVNLNRSSTQTFNKMFDESRRWGVTEPFLVHVGKHLGRFADFYERLRSEESLEQSADGPFAKILQPVWKQADRSEDFKSARQKLPAGNNIAHLFEGDVQIGGMDSNVWVLSGTIEAAE